MGTFCSIWLWVNNHADALAAIAATAALIFAGYQFRFSRKTADFVALTNFFETITARENAYFDATGKRQKEIRFHDWLNTLEVYAFVWNEKLVGTATRQFMCEKLVSVIAVIQSRPKALQDFNNAIDTPTTFEHLQKFKLVNKAAIDRLADGN